MLLLLRQDNCSHQTGFGYSCMWVPTVTCVTPLSSTSILWSFLKISNQACLHPLVEIPVFLPLCSSSAHSFEHLFLESQLIPFLFVTRLLCFEGMLSGPLHSSTLSSFVSSSTKFCHACLEWLFVWEKNNSDMCAVFSVPSPILFWLIVLTLRGSLVWGHPPGI